MSSPNVAVQQAEQKAEHASSLLRFEQAIQEPAAALPSSRSKQVGRPSCRVVKCMLSLTFLAD